MYPWKCKVVDKITPTLFSSQALLVYFELYGALYYIIRQTIDFPLPISYIFEIRASGKAVADNIWLT
jgi:hypothetical protein